MEDYIATFEDDILSNTYESVKKLAKDQGLAVYPMTKKWFLARFSSDKEVKQNTNAPSPISTLVDKQILAAG